MMKRRPSPQSGDIPKKKIQTTLKFSSQSQSSSKNRLPTSTDTTVTGNSTITKSGQSSSFTTTTTTDAGPPQRGPVAEPAKPKTDVGGEAKSLAAALMSDFADGTETHAYARLMDGLIETAAFQQMKKFSNNQLTLMAKILLDRPTHTIQEADPRIGALTGMVRDFLVETRPPAPVYKLQGAKKKTKESVPAKQQSTDTTAWLDKVMPLLEGDGFDEGGGLRRMRTNIDKLLQAISGRSASSEWAELRGYLFQIEQTLAARSRYRLEDVEPPITIPGSARSRFMDTAELVFAGKGAEPVLCLCEYKAYGKDQKPDADFKDVFQKQLDDYVRRVADSSESRHLRYVFPGTAPRWAFDKLLTAAADLKVAGKQVYLTEGSGTRILGSETDIFTTVPKPRIITATTTDDTAVGTPVVQPTAAQLPATPSVVVQSKDKQPPKKQKQKQKQKEDGQQRTLDAMGWGGTVHPPVSGRPRSASDVGPRNRKT
ncbi:hypothetical protein GCM10010149_19860 [Nonomuraea roseoviolacea subsp. roseoviolacea]